MALRSGHRAQVRDAALHDDDSHVLKRGIAKPLSPQHQTKRMIASVGQVALAVAVTIVALGIAVLASNPLSARGDSSDADAIAAFLDWFDAAGGVRNKRITIATFAGMGKGILASQDIREHDQLLFVPMHLVICRETIAQTASAQLQPQLQQLAGAPDELLTAFVLLEVLKPAAEVSRWRAYWQLLPRMDHAAAPLVFASTSELAALQDPHMVAAARREQQLATRAFHRFRQLFDAALPPSLTREDLERQYRWTRFLVSSRAFTVHGERLLVPFGDVFNGRAHAHARPAARGERFLTYHRVSDRGVEVRADRNVAAGAQVFEDYGDNSNYVYALHHGFVMADNPFDCAFAQLPRLEAIAARSGIQDDGNGDDADVLELRRHVLAHFRVENGPSVCIASDGSPTHESRQLAQFYAAVALTTADEMRSACGQPRHYEQCFLSSAAALAVGALRGSDSGEDGEGDDSFAALVARAVQTQLDVFATTRAEDEQLLLHNASLTAGLRAAIVFRLSRKQILHAALTALRTADPDAVARPAIEDVSIESGADIDTDETAAARIERFLRWIEQQHLPVNHLTLRFVSDAMGYGTFATKALARGEPYVSVPVGIVMDVQSATTSRSLRQLVRRLGRLAVDDDSVLLVLHLLNEAFGPNRLTSRWRAYLDVLPSVEMLGRSSPLFYDERKHMALLRATDLHASVRDYRSRVRRAYRTLQQHIARASGQAGKRGSGASALDWITESRFMWATAVLDSRSIWWSGQRHLVPLLDMVNCIDLGDGHAAHHTDLDTSTDASSAPAAVTRASWSFARGEQVVENYAQPNHIYLLYHGFVLTANKHDCAHVALTTNDRSAINALPQPRKRALMEMLEALALKTWTPELCVDPSNAASVARFAKVALLTETPLRALEVAGAAAPLSAPVTLFEVRAGLDVVARRIASLESGLRSSVNGATGDHRVTVIRSYLQQQLALFAMLQSALEQLERTPQVAQ